ncbi:MAG: 6-bladed beta-propeller, partial [Candidatus Kariarchaeaceae archaeon]
FDSQGILDNTYDTSYLQSPQTLTVLPNNDTLAITTSFSPGSSISVGNFLLHNKNSKSTGSSALMTGHSPPMDFDDAGDTMVVGDPGRNVAWVAEKTGGVWRFTSQLYDPEIERYQDGNARHTWFGTSVAIDGYGNTVVVGSPGMNLGNPKPGSKNYPSQWFPHFPILNSQGSYRHGGGVTVFTKEGGEWKFDERLIGPWGHAYMGMRVAIDYNGHCIYASVEYVDSFQPYVIGSAVINWFAWNPDDRYYSEWRPMAWIHGINRGSSEAERRIDPHLYGRRIHSLEINNGNSLVIGAYNADDTAHGISAAHTGVVRVYDYYARYEKGGDDNWPYYWVYYSSRGGMEGVLPYDQFGAAVAIDESGKTVVVGAPYHEHAEADISNTTVGIGRAYVYKWSANEWIRTNLEIPDPSPETEFGYSVAIDALGETIVVGAPGKNMQVGAVYVFGLIGRSGWGVIGTPGEWSPVSQLTRSGENHRDRNGNEVGISASGTMIWSKTRDWCEGYPCGESIIEYREDGSVNTQTERAHLVDPEGVSVSVARIDALWGRPDPYRKLPDIVSDPLGYIYASYQDNELASIRKYYQSATDLNLVKNFGWEVLESPQGLAIDSNNFIYVADTVTNRVYVFDTEGEIVHTITGAAGLDFSLPNDVAVDTGLNIYIADTGNNRIVKLDHELIWQASLDINGPAEMIA